MSFSDKGSEVLDQLFQSFEANFKARNAPHCDNKLAVERAFLELIAYSLCEPPPVLVNEDFDLEAVYKKIEEIR